MTCHDHDAAQGHEAEAATLRADGVAAEQRATEARRAAAIAAAAAQQHATRAAELQACCEHQQARLKVGVNLNA